MKTITKQAVFPKIPLKQRVAAYARVSGAKDAMLESLSAQVSYYSAYIQRRIDWEFAGVYADEAKTGTKSERPEFQRLLSDCRNGTINMVITKSITRFARNTVTTLETVRELKLLGIDVYFERENIHSTSGDGELMLSILAAYAQEESRSVSENCKWRIRKMFQEGKISGMSMLGYRVKNGKLVVVPEEALIVQAIFEDYLSGMGIIKIAKKLRYIGIKISTNGVSGILRNEKYQGDMLLQKTIVADHLTKRKVKNTGQLPQYYVENSHEAIIDRETFSAVQVEIARRATMRKPMKVPTESYPFTGLIRCGKCNAPYKRKHANASTKYEKIVWICHTFNMLGKTVCDSQQIPETILTSIVDEIGGLENISAITVIEHYMLKFHLKNGDTKDIRWQHPSRRESWTPEMKQIAHENELKRIKERKNSHEQK